MLRWPFHLLVRGSPRVGSTLAGAPSPLADAAVLALLMLMQYSPPADASPSQPKAANSFREALQRLSDADANTSDSLEDGLGPGTCSTSYGARTVV